MLLSELIAALTQAKETHGDLPCVIMDDEPVARVIPCNKDGCAVPDYAGPAIVVLVQ